MWAITGLGNPGQKYVATRHNIGFDLCDRLTPPGFRWRKSFGGEFAQAGSSAEQLLILKPMSFMNLSGGPVRELLTFYKLGPEHLIVLHDDIDLELGQLRMKRGGGDGGHNGLRSITEALGTPNYIRIRLGVGKPAPGRDTMPRTEQVSTWVLTRFSNEERFVVEQLLVRANQAVHTVIAEGLGVAQNRFNG